MISSCFLSIECTLLVEQVNNLENLGFNSGILSGALVRIQQVSKMVIASYHSNNPNLILFLESFLIF